MSIERLRVRFLRPLRQINTECFMELLRAENISKKYGKKSVLTEISFALNECECIGIVGANGCGKSTLLSIIAGASRAGGGSLYIRGTDVFRYSKILSYAVGYVPQTDPIIEELSVADNLRLWYSLAGRKFEEDCGADGRLTILGMTEVLKKRAGILSGGMKRRLSIAGALAANSEILILDEPSTGLDVVGRDRISQYIKEYVKSGRGAILSTHIQEELDMCTRVYLLENGRLREMPADITFKKIAELLR